MNSDIWNRLKELACGQSGHYCCEPLGPLFLDIAGCLHPVVTRWQCSGALKNPSVSVLCVLVQRLDRVLWLNEWVLRQDKHAVNILDDIAVSMRPSLLLEEVMLCWGRSSTETTGIGLFTTKPAHFLRHRTGIGASWIMGWVSVSALWQCT